MMRFNTFKDQNTRRDPIYPEYIAINVGDDCQFLSHAYKTNQREYKSKFMNRQNVNKRNVHWFDMCVGY